MRETYPRAVNVPVRYDDVQIVVWRGRRVIPIESALPAIVRHGDALQEGRHAGLTRQTPKRRRVQRADLIRV